MSYYGSKRKTVVALLLLLILILGICCFTNNSSVELLVPSLAFLFVLLVDPRPSTPDGSNAPLHP